METQQVPSNLGSIKTRFTYRFLLALKKLNRNKPGSSSVRDTYRRCNMIRVASYASMASAVGPKRTWSRAILWKIRSRTQLRTLSNKRRIDAVRRRKSMLGRNPNKELGLDQEDDLRKLVPGGEGMDFFRLLNETAHYIKCLRAQVQIMKNIADHYSA